MSLYSKASKGMEVGKERHYSWLPGKVDSYTSTNVSNKEEPSNKYDFEQGKRHVVNSRTMLVEKM